MINSITEVLREIHTVLSADKFSVMEIRISFDAPNPKNPKLETLSLDKLKKNESLFQWVKYSLLFKDVKGDDYVYIVNLNPWGTKQENATIYKSDDKGNIYKFEDVDILPATVERLLSSLLKDPDLIPPQKYRINYINTNEKDKGHVYSGEEFKRYFDNNFYTVFSKDKKITNPFGRLIGEGAKKETEELDEEIK